jgi:hypothetical protein
MKKRIRRAKSSISKADSYSEIGRFWDEHSLDEFWHETRRVKATGLSRPIIQRVHRNFK